MKRDIIKFSLPEIEPVRAPVFHSQGIGPGVTPSPVVFDLYEAGVDLFLKLAEPIGIISEISLPEFVAVYSGEGKNEEHNPLDKIYPRASHLALFAATIGTKVSREINRLLNGGDFALGFMLDSIASFSADKAAALVENFFLNVLLKDGRVDNATRVLNYSPGYCGWHISGQAGIFNYLHPEEIGITLNESYLMIPLKSVSGVLIAGEKTVHYFKNNFSFCKECKLRNCRQRIKSLK